MKRMLLTAYKIPRWISTIMIVVLVTYLTLDPDPLPDNNIRLFEGADKVVHGLMFLAVAFCLQFDLSRRSARSVFVAIANVIVVSAYGGLIEILQGSMGLGRSADIYDFIADAFGAVVGVICAVWFLKFTDYGRRD